MLGLRNFFRLYSSASHGHGSHAASASLWKKLSLFVALPAVGACYVNMHFIEKEEAEHRKDHKPEFIPYEHLRLRKKPFPWGDGNHSLFHNKEVNALPEGYEE